MKMSNNSSTTEQINQKVGLPTLAGTNTQLQLQSNDNLSDNIQGSTRLGHTGHPEAHNTWDEDNSLIHQSYLHQNPEPVQRIAISMITEL